MSSDMRRNSNAIIIYVAKRIRQQNSSSGVSVQQSVGLNPGHDTCVPEKDTQLNCFSPPRGK